MTNQNTLKLPNQVIDSNWKDDIDYEPFEEEKTYISPTKVKKETLAKIKKSPIKLAINNMVDWKKITNQVVA